MGEVTKPKRRDWTNQSGVCWKAVGDTPPISQSLARFNRIMGLQPLWNFNYDSTGFHFVSPCAFTSRSFRT